MSDNLIDQFDDIERRRQASARPAAAMSDPEAYAKAERWAPQLGLPVETVARNIGAVKPQVIEADAAEAASRSPALAVWLGDLDNARVGIDQAPSLAAMEGSVRDIMRRPVIETITETPNGRLRLSAPQAPKPTLSTIARGLGTSALTGFAQAGLGIKMAMGDALDAVAPSMSWTDVYGKVQTVDLGDSSGDQRQFSAEKNKAALARPDIKGPGRYVYGGVESLLQTAPSIGASILMRNPAPALAMGGVQSGATQYGEVRTRGGSAGEAALAGGATGAVEVVTEKIPLGFIVDRFGKTEFKRFVGGMLAREIPSEQIATLAQDAIDTAIANPDATWEDYWAARPEAAAQTLASTVIQAGAIGAPSLIMSSREGAQAQRDLERAGNAPAVKAKVDRLVEAVRASPMPERSPERFAALMNAISEDQEVRIPADKVREYLQTLDPDQQQAFLDATELGDQLDAAYGEASDVFMPAGEYLSKIGPTPAHDALSTYVGWGENMSEAEAKSYEETYSELAASQAEEMGDVLATAEREASPGRAVFEDVQRQAREAGYTADAARVYARVFADRYEARAAASPNLYPDAMAAYEASRVQIRGEVPEGVSAAQRVGRLDVMIDSVRQGRKPAASRGPSLLDFISRNGGIVDQGGELASLDAGSWHRGKPGRRKLLREAGDDTGINNEFAIERVVDRAIENGYLPEGSQPGDLMTAIADEMRGRPSFATPADQRSEDFKAASDQLEELMGRLGLNVDTASNEEIKAALEAYSADPGADGSSYEQGGGLAAVEARWKVAGIDASLSEGKDITVGKIVVPKDARGAGVGSAAMKALTDYADSVGKRVVLTPSKDFGGTVTRLRAFYKRFGFIENKGRSRDFSTQEGMIREPARSFNQSPTETDAFKAWFGDSKVVDESGKPLVVYHGTAGNVEAFDLGLSGSSTNAASAGEGIWFTSDASVTATSYADYAATDAKTAKLVRDSERLEAAGRYDDAVKKMDEAERLEAQFSDQPLDGQNIVPVYLSIKNPLEVDAVGNNFTWFQGRMGENIAEAKRLGYDGMIIRNFDDAANRSGVPSDHYVVFEPTQIKSVNNSGRFDPADPRILEQRARGNITLSDAGAVIRLFQGRDLSTLLHEGAHLWLEELRTDATAPGASDALKADWQAVKDYLGLDSSHDFGDIPVEAHETFARSGEAYFLEGKSPSLALRDVMARLKAWMLRIYRTIAKLNVPMDDNIRGVFDRLIATQEEITAAQQGQALNRLFTDPKTAGMTAAEYERYTRQDQQAQGAAHDRLLKRTMETIRRQRTAEWREEREGLREDVEAEIDAQPDIAVLRIMAEGKMAFSRQALVDAYGSDAVLARMPRRVPPLYSDKGGLLPDVAAQGVGASSGEALVDALMNYEAQRQDLKAKGDKRSVRTFRVDEALDAEMISRHGDVLSDGSIEQEAFDALHERRRGALLAAEGAKLSELAKSETSPWSREAFEVFAREKIGAMRATKIRPAAFLRAERSAGIAAQRAWMTGNAKKALEAKFTQTVNFHLYRAALDAEAATNKAQALFEKVMSGKDADVAKNRNLDMVQAARAILASYGYLDRRGSASAYIKALAEYDGATAATLQPYVDAAVIAAAEIGLRSNAAPAIDLATTDEFADLAAVIQQLWTMSRADKVVEIEGRKVRIDAISQELRDNLLATHGLAPTAPGGGSAVTSGERAKAEFQGLLASFKKVEEWAARQGPAFTRYVWRPIKDAADAYRADKNTYLSRLHDALKVIEPDFKNAAKIEAPELGYIFGGEKNAGLAELIGALRHVGNDSNKRKLLLGRGWGSENEDGSVDTSRWDAFLARMIAEGRLEKRHFDYVQAEWDLHDDIKPLAQKAHRAMYGRYFEEVTANAFVTPWGEYKGGYVAAKVDAAIDARAGQLDDSDLLNGGRSGTFMFPGPANGFTKSRVEYNRPLDLNLRLVIRQMDDVLKFAHLGPAVRDVNRILTQRDFKAALDAYDPTAWGDMLLPWLERAVSQRLTTPSRGKAGRFLDRTSGFVSRNTGMTIMFGSLVNTAQQVTGLPVAALRTGKRNMGAALVDYLANPAKMTETVTAASRLMADRNRSQMVAITDAANDIVLNPNLYEKVVNWTARHAYFMQHAFQNVLDPIIWTAARNRAVELGEENPEAYADAVVSSTQGSRNAEDVTRFTTGPAWAAPFKMFSGYFLDQANMLTTEWVKSDSAGRKAEIYALGFLIPSLGAQLIADLLRGGWDDDEGDGYLDEFMSATILSQVRYALAMIPIGGQAVNLAINRFDGKPYNDKLSLSPAASMVETIAAVPFDLVKIVQGEGNAGRTVKDVLTAISLITGLPPIQRQAGYVADVASGKVEPTGPVDATRGFITGTASPVSRE